MALAWLAAPVVRGVRVAELVVAGVCGCPYPGLVSLHLLLGSRNQAFAALTRSTNGFSPQWCAPASGGNVQAVRPSGPKARAR